MNRNQQMMTEQIFFMTNAQPMNQVVVHKRMADGSLQPMGAYDTGGNGAGVGPLEPYHDPLGSQDSIVVDRMRKTLYVVNACSDSISAFRIGDGMLELIGQTNSGGHFPVSLALHGDMLYALNAGGDGSISGFSIGMDGALAPIMDSTRNLGVGNKQPPFVFTAPGQIAISPAGKWLVVVEKGIKNEDQSTHKLHVFALNGNMPSAMPVTTHSEGWLPFSATFTQEGKLLVVEAFGAGPGIQGTGAITSYDIQMDGRLVPVTVSADTHNKEACWIALANGHAYTTNFASHTISAFAVMSDGTLRESNMDGVATATGAGSFPIDIAASPDEHTLYVLLPGIKALAAYRVGMDGALMPAGQIMGD